LSIFWFAISSIIENNKSEKLLLAQSIDKTSNMAKKLLSNKHILEFVKKHLFRKETRDFKEFVAGISNGYFAQDLEVSQGDQIELGQLVKTTYRIVGMFWHDSFIFKFIEGLKDFSPGFVRILSLEIDKFAKISSLKPVIKMETKCEIYSAK
jgi:hypothetical protein